MSLTRKSVKVFIAPASVASPGSPAAAAGPQPYPEAARELEAAKVTGTLALYDTPALLTLANVGFVVIVSIGTLVPEFRPPAIDTYTQLALGLLVITMASTAALPAYVLMRAHVASMLELVPRDGGGTRAILRFPLSASPDLE